MILDADGLDELERLIQAGDTQGVARAMATARSRGDPLEPYIKALDAAAKVYWDRRPPVQDSYSGHPDEWDR